MEPNNLIMGGRPISDVIIRIRTNTRDEWIYCHSRIVSSKSHYIAHVLSEAPLREILDLRDCVNIFCNDAADFDSYVTILRHFYNPLELFNSVKNAISVFRTTHRLGCPDIIASCIEFIEAVPWEEAEEELIEKLPHVGPTNPRVRKSSVIKVVDYHANPDIMIKAIEVTEKIFDAIVYGSIILGTGKRVHIVKIWLPFFRVMKPIMVTGEDEEFWRSLESAIITTILTFSLDEKPITTISRLSYIHFIC